MTETDAIRHVHALQALIVIARVVPVDQNGMVVVKKRVVPQLPLSGQAVQWMRRRKNDVGLGRGSGHVLVDDHDRGDGPGLVGGHDLDVAVGPMVLSLLNVIIFLV